MTTPASAFAASQVRRSFQQRLVTWYRRHARPLPWRENRDPYRVWISEIMLQQTQVATVEPYFHRFVTELPHLAALAAADESQVLRLWEGLGYYRRARQLHRAAQVIVAKHAGRFPSDSEAVRSLPGIGRYTAGAILSIAFDASEPILEANTVRLFSRIIGFDGDPTKAVGANLLWQTATDLLPASGAGEFNQALMELGSRICTPREPACGECPLASYCVARQQGRQAEIPRAKAKPRIEAVREAAVVVRRRGRVLVIQRREGERWAGLWDFPRFALDEPQTRTTTAAVSTTQAPDNCLAVRLKNELCRKVAAQTGVTIKPIAKLATLVHSVTRFRITLDCYTAEFVDAGGDRPDLPPHRWLRPAELEAIPLCVTGRKLARLITAEEAATVRPVRNSTRTARKK